MAIRINLDVMMAKRKIGLTELAKEVDITLANLSILKNGKAKAVRLETLNAICQTLKCQPGDILEYVPIAPREQNKMKPRVDKLIMEQRREGYEDEFRNIAWFGPVGASEPAEYIALIDGVEKYEYLEIERFAGEAKLYLNGEFIGSNLVPGQERKQHQYRPYRFDINLRDGQNELKIVSTTYEGERAAFSGYVRLARMLRSYCS